MESTGLFDTLPWEITQMILQGTGKYGWICRFVSKMWQQLSRSGNLSTRNWQRWIGFVAKGGFENLLFWAIDQGCPFVEQWLYKKAGQSGKVSILSRLEGMDIQDFLLYSCLGGGKKGHVNVLEWCGKTYPEKFAHVEKMPEWFESLRSIAASNGHAHILEWIWDKFPFVRSDKNWKNGVCFAACKNGRTNILEWLFSELTPLEKESWFANYFVTVAVKNGHLDTLKWLMAHGGLWEDCFFESVHRGNVDILEWISNPDIPLLTPCPPVPTFNWQGRSIRFTKIVAELGHLSALIWLVDHGYSFSIKKTAKGAVRELRFHILDWLDENSATRHELFETRIHWIKCIFQQEDYDYRNIPLKDFTVSSNRIAILQWARQRGYFDQGKMIVDCIAAMHFEPWTRPNLQWAKDNGHLNQKVIDHLIRCGHKLGGSLAAIH